MNNELDFKGSDGLVHNGLALNGHFDGDEIPHLAVVMVLEILDAIAMRESFGVVAIEMCVCVSAFAWTIQKVRA